MIITNLTKTSISFIGRRGLPYEIKPLGTLTLPEKDVTDEIMSNLIDQNLVSVSGWQLDTPSVTVNNRIAGERPNKDILTTGHAVTSYVKVPPNSTAVVLSGTGTGAIGDTINRMIITVTSEATSSVTLTDGSGGGTTLLNYAIFPNDMGIGTHILDLGDMPSINGPWKASTGAGASVIFTGMFS